MTKEEAFELIKNKPHLAIHGALFTTNIFGETVQRRGKEVFIDGDDIKIIDTKEEDNFLDSILPANNDFSKLISTQSNKTEDTWYIAQHRAAFFNEPLPVNTANENAGDSIFSHEQETGVNSKLGNWYKPIKEKIDVEKKRKEEEKKKLNENYENLPKECICKNEVLTAEDLRYIVTQLRKKDEVKYQAQYEPKSAGKWYKNPIYIDKNGKLYHFLNSTDAEKLKLKKYKIETSFYDRADDFDGKPLLDRIFFFESGGFNLNSEYANYETFAKYLNETFIKFKIKKCIQKIHFLTQIYWETNRFRSTFEAEPKNTYSGGSFYGGRGMKQITHDYNYLNFYEIHKGKGKNFFNLYMTNREDYKNSKGDVCYESVVAFNKRTTNQYISVEEMKKFDEFVSLLSTSIYWACESAGWYWDKCKLNDFATDEDKSIRIVSAKVNNPNASNDSNAEVNGLKERKMYFEFLKEIFDYENFK